MTTSGTIAQTEITVEDMLSHAFMRCGKLPSTVSGELLAKSRKTLYMMLADLANDGINLWRMTKSVVNVVPRQAAYQLPVGTTDVTNMLYRTLWSYDSIQTVEVDAVVVEFADPHAINNVTGSFQTGGEARLAVEWSTDGITSWVPLVTLAAVDVVAGASFTIDLDTSAEARFWRLRDESGVLLPLDDLRFRMVRDEVTMARLNRDDYTNLPNKYTVGQRSLQFWFDKQNEPRVWIWPVSTHAEDQVVIWAAAEIEDPGDLTNTLAVPTRWYRAVLARLSRDVAMLIPAAELPAGRLADLKADELEAMTRASNGESDGSPYQLAPRISGYTR